MTTTILDSWSWFTKSAFFASVVLCERINIFRRCAEGDMMDPAASGDAEQEHHASSRENFDVTLPAKHSYLGQLREVSSTPYYPENDLVLLPIVHVPDVVLMPNQLIPINVDPDELDLNPILNDFLDAEHQRKGFVCMAARVDSDEMTHPHYYFGTVASVVRIENGEHGPEGIKMIVRGCQRCYLKKCVTDGGAYHQKHFGWFRILPNDGIPSPLLMFMPNEWKLPLRVVRGSAAFGAYLTSYDPLVFSPLDTQSLVDDIIFEIKKWQLTSDFPDDPSEFSYWVSANIPLSAHVRLQLLGAASTTHRLRSCLTMLKLLNELSCSGCHIKLAAKEDGICMTRGSLTAAYMNPHGLTQEIFTVKTVSKSIHLHGEPTFEYTWFPGYKWRHLYCRGCRAHLGWRYDAGQPNLTPHFFYGLRRGDVTLTMGPEKNIPPEEWPECIQQKMTAMTPVIYRDV